MFSEIKNTRFFMERSLDKRAPVCMENKALSHCVFDNCSIGTQDDAAKISRFKNIRLSDCEILNCMVGPAVFEDIEINNLKTGDIAVFNTPLLKRVRLAGKIGKLKISNTGFDLIQGLSGEILRFKDDFYADTDWALDISRAQFLDFYCLGVPARLITINHENQFVAQRSRILESGVLDSDFAVRHPVVGVMLQFLIDSGESETVLAAPMAKAKKQRDAVLAGLLELKERGIVA